MVKSSTTTNTTTTTTNNNKAMKRQYKGVRMRSWGSWVSEIRAPNQKTRIWLGSYSTPEAAARAYDAALLCLKGSSAALNFALPLPYHPPSTTSLSPKCIQRLAAAAAANFTTTNTIPTSPPSPSPPSPMLSSDTAEETSVSCCITAPVEDESSTESIESWFDFGAFQSPKCMDLMLNNCAFFAPPPAPQVEEFDEVGDISLWSFC